MAFFSVSLAVLSSAATSFFHSIFVTAALIIILIISNISFFMDVRHGFDYGCLLSAY